MGARFNALAAALLAFIIAGWVSPASADFPAPLKTRNVFILVIDGARYKETFGDSTHANIPFIWNQLRPLGVIYTGTTCGGANNTETCPGHASIMTGAWQSIANDGSVRPHTPTIFEYFRKQTGAPPTSCFYVGGKTKLSILQYSDSIGYGALYGGSARIPPANRQYHDTMTYSNIRYVMAFNKPNLMIANFGQVDSCGHAGSGTEGPSNASYGRYSSAIKQADSLCFLVWGAIQADPFYKDQTTLIIVNDHGRHDTTLTCWPSHGDQCKGCKHIMMLVLGPDTRANVVDSSATKQIDIAPTVGRLMGFSTPYVAGSVLSSALPVTAVVPRLNALPGNRNFAITGIKTAKSTAVVRCQVPAAGHFTVSVFDPAGRVRSKSATGNLAQGGNTVQINLASLGTGIYFVQLAGSPGVATSGFVLASGAQGQ